LTALTAKAALVDPASLGDDQNVIATSIPRSEIEEALKADAASELYLDVARERDGQREAEQRITVSWETEDLERLLKSTPGDEVTFAFKPDELARMFEEPDVEAQGLREKMAVLTIAATTAAGISAGVASGMVANPTSESGGGGGATAAFVTDATSSGPQASTEAAASLQAQEHSMRMAEQSEQGGTVSNLVTDTTSSGPQAATDTGGVSNLVTDTTSSGPQAVNEASSGGQFLTDATSSGPQAVTEASSGGQFLTDATSSGPQAVTEAASTTGGGQSFIESQGGKAALAGGLMLLILGAGFVGSRHRRDVSPA
jgi:hypothetical protein